jgi:hypothetical protein
MGGTLMEPERAAGRHKRMFADTDAIRALGSANAAHAADLAELASRLTAMSIASTSLGPVCARFASALTDAAVESARAVTAAAERLSDADAVAHAAARAYERADHTAGTRIAGI